VSRTLATVAAVASRSPSSIFHPGPTPRPPAAGPHAGPDPREGASPLDSHVVASAGVFGADGPARIGASRPPQTLTVLRRTGHSLSAGWSGSRARGQRLAIPVASSLHGSPRMAASPRRSQARERPPIPSARPLPQTQGGCAIALTFRRPQAHRACRQCCRLCTSIGDTTLNHVQLSPAIAEPTGLSP